MKAASVVRVAGTGLWMPGRAGGGDDRPTLPVDLSRVRRMDRFGRSGFFAGSLALADAGIAPRRPPDPALGVVFGSAHGCRDSLVDFTLELSKASTVEQLSPAVFAETVHNTVNGELAIAWGLGGPSEAIVSGRTGGADAILRAADLVRTGRAGAVVAGGAEGVHPRTAEWWEEERDDGRPLPHSQSPSLAGAALVLAPAEPGGAEGGVILEAAAWFSEPDPSGAARRTESWILGSFAGRARPTIVLATPDLDGAFSGWQCRRLPDETGEIHGAAGAVAAVLAIRALGLGSTVGAVIICRDPAGPVTLLGFTPRTV